jgi:Flp pilus assembly protein protease CpaA
MMDVSVVFFLTVLAKCVGLAALVVAATSDLRRRIIPNEAVLVVAGAGLMVRLLDFQGVALAISGAIALGLLVVLGQLARFDIIGGGDAKLIAALSLSQPAADVPALLLHIAMAGGGVAALYLARGCLSSQPLRVFLRSQSIPYGVAILLGTLSINLLEVSRQCVAAPSCWS